jgi:hypothetical protein
MTEPSRTAFDEYADRAFVQVRVFARRGWETTICTTQVVQTDDRPVGAFKPF